jgi:hypothetical protein
MQRLDDRLGEAAVPVPELRVFAGQRADRPGAFRQIQCGG